MIGILIALQINNSKEVIKQKDKEVQFLKNVKADLILEESELDRYIEIRGSMVNSAQIIPERFNGQSVKDLNKKLVEMINEKIINS